MHNFNPDLREKHIIGSQTRESIVTPQVCRALSRYHIALAGVSYACAPFVFVRLRPQMSQVLACIEGEGEVWLNGGWERCRAGQVYLTPAHVFHAYHALEGCMWKVCWVSYDAQRMEHSLIRAEQPALVEGDGRGLLRALEGLYQECLGSDEEAVQHQWTHLVQVYARRHCEPMQGDQRLSRLWQTVDANLAHPWNSAALTRIAGMSAEHLRRLCQQQFSQSPMQHVTALRMQRAKALLVSDSASVESVAQRVGYENPFAFSTAFKRYTGMPPSAFRSRT